jgi:hypothetical protein
VTTPDWSRPTSPSVSTPFGSAQATLARCPGNDLRVDYYEVDDGNPDD